MGNFLNTKQPPSVVESNAWLIEDDFGNEVKEGEQVYVLQNGETVHLDAAEDYMIEKLKAKVTSIANDVSENVQELTPIFVLPNGTWFNIDSIEDYFIDVLDAQVFERVKLLPKQKEQHPNV